VRLFRRMQDKVRKKLAPAALRERNELVDVDVARAAGTRRAVCLFVFVCVCVCMYYQVGASCVGASHLCVCRVDTPPAR
jgi:hypothetical protein